eukprot:252377-Rhodomonas_salina.1
MLLPGGERARGKGEGAGENSPSMSLPSFLRACYAMSGTELAYHAMRCVVLSKHIVLRARYAMCSTEVLAMRIVLRACYAMPGTEMRYAPTRRERSRVWWYQAKGDVIANEAKHRLE